LTLILLKFIMQYQHAAAAVDAVEEREQGIIE